MSKKFIVTISLIVSGLLCQSPAFAFDFFGLFDKKKESAPVEGKEALRSKLNRFPIENRVSIDEDIRRESAANSTSVCRERGTSFYTAGINGLAWSRTTAQENANPESPNPIPRLSMNRLSPTSLVGMFNLGDPTDEQCASLHPVVKFKVTKPGSNYGHLPWNVLSMRRVSPCQFSYEIPASLITAGMAPLYSDEDKAAYQRGDWSSLSYYVAVILTDRANERDCPKWIQKYYVELEESVRNPEASEVGYGDWQPDFDPYVER